ncbi:hypothetical protein EVAR_100814_1 [Eumeta japonica]|uniref:Uncharacterized protein n=1 Tax=Eumeta variegata TaxID=151549 RepID=A0A4C2AA15_EUMVA|nr:hypothetical protein EVAR_100814_1 [Eumeta japonica]
MEAYKALLVISDDFKHEHEAVLTKVDADFLTIFELADCIELAFDGLRYEEESKRTAGPGLSSNSFADTEGSISHLSPLSLTQFSGEIRTSCRSLKCSIAW